MAELDPRPPPRRRARVVAGPAAGALVLLGEDPQSGHLDPVDHQQCQGRDEQRTDLGRGHRGVRHVDAEVVCGQAAAVAEGHGRVELRAVIGLGHPPTMPPYRRVGKPAELQGRAVRWPELTQSAGRRLGRCWSAAAEERYVLAADGDVAAALAALPDELDVAHLLDHGRADPVSGRGKFLLPEHGGLLAVRHLHGRRDVGRSDRDPAEHGAARQREAHREGAEAAVAVRGRQGDRAAAAPAAAVRAAPVVAGRAGRA